MTITDAVIPVGGLGTRLLPATKSQPKEMLPVVGTPVVQYVIDELARAGIRRVLFVTGRRKRAIEDHFDADPELERVVGAPLADPSAGMQVLYTRQPRPLGLGDALRYARGFAGERPVVVALGDAIIGPHAGPGIVRRLVAAHEQHGAEVSVAVEEVALEHVSRYGIVAPRAPLAGGAMEISDLVEKPAGGSAPSRLAVAARYVLGPAVFAALEQIGPDARGEVQLADAVRLVIAEGGRALAVALADGERRHDIGTVESYCATFLEFAFEHPGVGPGLRARAAALLDGGG